jgi:hypothetical protein
VTLQLTQQMLVVRHQRKENGQNDTAGHIPGPQVPAHPTDAQQRRRDQKCNRSRMGQPPVVGRDPSLGFGERIPARTIFGFDLRP